MLSHELRFPVAYHDGIAYFLERSENWSATYFGGPLDVNLSGIRYGTRRLHHILTLDSDQIPRLSECGVFRVPLVYGMCYSGCSMKYKLSNKHGNEIEIVQLTPRKSSPNWPYRDYPPLLPCIPLKVAEKKRCSPQSFVRFSCQESLEVKSHALTAIVPAMFQFGVSMWGRWGDAEDVQIIFQCDLKKLEVNAFNQCT
jgi:hypothetical protein